MGTEDIPNTRFTDKDLFVLYSPPDDANHYLIVQSEEESNENENAEAFLFSPFHSADNCKEVRIRKDLFLTNPFIDFRIGKSLIREVVNKEDYIHQANTFIDACKSGYFDKIVLSRIKVIEREGQNLMPLFLSMKQKYSQAFIYMINIPGQSCWIGATPESLLHKRDQEFGTMALAGTRKTQEKEIVWGEKEKHEQELVGEYFEEVISQFDTHFTSKGPFTKKAGKIEHLCTKYNFTSGETMERILQSFHPSPAVCGIPKKEAKKIITDTEVHQRRYYTGYLGTVSSKGDADIYVNLRCMEVSQNQFYLYVGCGITDDSNAESEWEETELKAATLSSIIEKMYLYADVNR